MGWNSSCDTSPSFHELEKHSEAWQPLLAAARRGRLTLVYSAHDTEHNNAIALKEFLERKINSINAASKAVVRARDIRSNKQRRTRPNI
jgi:hypothetical protein